MRPRHIPQLSVEASRRLVEEDKRPLGDSEKEYLKKCLKIYMKNPIKEE